MTDETKSNDIPDPALTRALEKYSRERDKRLRKDGIDQYIKTSGEFELFSEDPFSTRVEREPLFDSVDDVIVGGGFGGLLTAARPARITIDDQVEGMIVIGGYSGLAKEAEKGLKALGCPWEIRRLDYRLV